MNRRILNVCLLLSIFFLFAATAGAQMFPGLGAMGDHSGASSASIVQPTAVNPLSDSCIQFGGGTNSCSYPVNVTAGNEAYILVIAGATGTIATPTESAGTATFGTFTVVGAGSTAGGAQQWYRASITRSGSATIQEVFSASTNVGVFVFEVANDGGVDTGTNPTYNNGSCFTSTCNNVTITTTTNNDLVLYAIMGGGSSTYSALTPYTASGNGTGSAGNNVAWMTGNLTKGTAGAIAGTYTTSGNVNNQNSVIAIK